MSNAAQPLDDAYELIEKGDLEAARSLLVSIQADFEDNPDYWWIYAHAVDDAEAGRQALERVRSVAPDYPGLDALVAESEKGPTTQVRPLRPASPPPPPPGPSTATRPNQPVEDFEDFDTEVSDEPEGQPIRNNRQLLIAIGGLAFLVLIIAGILLLPRIVGGGGDTPTQVAAINTTNPTVTDAAGALSQDLTDEATDLTDAVVSTEDQNLTGVTPADGTPPDSAEEQDANATLASVDDDDADTALPTIALDDDATALSEPTGEDTAGEMAATEESEDDGMGGGALANTATTPQVEMERTADTPTDVASVAPTEEVVPLQSPDSTVADTAGPEGTTMPDGGTTPDNGETTDGQDETQSSNTSDSGMNTDTTTPAQGDDVDNATTTETEEVNATTPMQETSPATATVVPDDLVATALPQTSEANATITITPDTTSTANYAQLALNLSELGVPEDGIRIEETALGEALVFTVCSVPGPRALQSLIGIIDVLAESNLNGDLAAIAFGVTDCETDEVLRQVGLPISILYAYGAGNITRSDLQRLLRPIG